MMADADGGDGGGGDGCFEPPPPPVDSSTFCVSLSAGVVFLVL